MIIISIGDIIGKAFEFAKKYGLPMAGMLFAAGVLGRLVSMIFNVGGSHFLQSTKGVFQLAAIGPILASSFLPLLISTVVSVSIFASILEILRNNGGRYRFDHGLSPIVYLKVVGCQLIYGFVVGFGLIFLIAPGIFFAVRWVFAPIYLIDHPEAGIGEALRASWDKTADQFWALLGLGIVVGIIAGAGLVVCCVGYFFTMIILYAAQVITYRLLWQDGEENANEEQFVRFGRDDLYV